MNIWWYIVVVKVMHIHEIFVAKDDDHKSLLYLVCFWSHHILVKAVSFSNSFFFLFSNHYSHYFLRPGSYFTSIGPLILEYDWFL